MRVFRVSSLFGLLGLLMLHGCSGGGTTAEAGNAPSASMESVHAVLREALAATSALGYDALVARLGPPVRERTVLTASGSPDSLRTLVYHGVEFSYRAVSSPPANRPVQIALTDARYTSPEGLRVGYAEEHVRKTLGPPSQQAASEWVYSKTEPIDCDLIVFLEQHKVSRVEWRFH